jgi:adenosylcobyric acid synthase
VLAQGGALHVSGTGSDVGKSSVVTGLCRLLGRRGVAVAPFKAQNMALNSWVTDDGAEIGRAQGVQALAAGVPAEAAMNPILLKPTGDRTSQVIVMGRPWRHLDARDFYAAKPKLAEVVDSSVRSLRRRFDVVVCEGAGSPAEINLLEHDLANLSLAAAQGIPSVIVGDIERGGVFAALYGTVMLLPSELRATIGGFLINKFRGDRALLDPGLAELERRTGIPVLGVLPWIDGVELDAEDSLALSSDADLQRNGTAMQGVCSAPIDVAVVRFPRISNFTDVDALSVEADVRVRFVSHPGTLGKPDLLVLPGTKATLDDLQWLHRTGLAAALDHLVSGPGGPIVLAICGGYQMAGHRIVDGVESGQAAAAGLGWLPVETVFAPTKLTRRRRGRTVSEAGWGEHDVAGFEIRYGRPRPVTSARGTAGGGADVRPWLRLSDGYGSAEEGMADPAAGVYGTSMHGLLENDGVRGQLLGLVAARCGRRRDPTDVCFDAVRGARFDRLADALEQHADVDRLFEIMSAGALRPAERPS